MNKKEKLRMKNILRSKIKYFRKNKISIYLVFKALNLLIKKLFLPHLLNKIKEGY